MLYSIDFPSFIDLQLTFVFSNTRYLKLCSIWKNLFFPLVIWHLIKEKNYRYLKSWYLKFLPLSNGFSSPLSNFILLSRTFLKIFKTICNFFLKLVFSQLVVTQLLQLCKQEWVKTLYSNFFIECFDSSMYWRQAHRFLSRTPLKTGFQPQRQPL